MKAVNGGMSDISLQQAYATCHNVQDFLYFCGYKPKGGNNKKQKRKVKRR